MSGYPLRSAYDATQKRKKYLEELALRARLDDENLQANKLYKRTGAISTPPDTRTTTEKLADIYRLRIDIRSKLGQLMSGDDAQKVVNRLDAQELVFLAGRIDKYIAELKPKYSMGMPYQVFIKFFKDAVSNFMAYGDIDINSAAIFENVARTEELKNSIDEMIRELQLAGKKDLILKIEGLNEFYELINQAKMILPNVADPNLQQNIEASLIAIENIPTAYEIDDLRNRYEQAVRTNSVVLEREISAQLQEKLEAVKQLEGEKEALKQNLETLRQDVVQQATMKLIGTSTYYGNFIPITNERYFTSGLNGGAIKLFQEIVDVAFKEGDDKQLEFEQWKNSHSPLFDRIRNKTSGKPYVDVLNKIGGIAKINQFIQENKDFINNFMEIKELNFPKATVVSSDSSSGSSSDSSSGSSSTPMSQTLVNLANRSGGSSSGNSINGTRNIVTGAQVNFNQSGSKAGSNISSVTVSGKATPQSQSQSQPEYEILEKIRKIEEAFSDNGKDYNDLIIQASNNDVGGSDENTISMGIEDVILNMDVLDVVDDKFIGLIDNFLEDIVSGSWDTSKGQFREYLKSKSKRLQPQPPSVAEQKSSSSRASSRVPSRVPSRTSSQDSVPFAPTDTAFIPSSQDSVFLLPSRPPSRASTRAPTPKAQTPTTSRPPSRAPSRAPTPINQPTFNYLNNLGGNYTSKKNKDKKYKSIVEKDEEIRKRLERPPLSYIQQLKQFLDIQNGVNLAIEEGIRFMLNSYVDVLISLGQLKDIDEIGDFVSEYLDNVLFSINEQSIPPTVSDFYEGYKKMKSGKGLIGKKPKMKGGSVRIDINAGMKDDTNIPKYVPFGRYIINRSKLNDGVVMIKRPNGAFMGDLQSRRVSNNLRNIFEKVVGGAIPTYQDLSKLDEDEKQYLHYVSKKANLVDKLQVPTPNKDEEERMINRYEILRGQLVAGNDNREMIKEFKKLLLDMSDRKLLPRRQVSDILIDIEKMYG